MAGGSELNARRRFLPSSIALIAALSFVVLASTGITVQGLQYDEVFQAPAAFAWTGQSPPFFAQFPVYGIPVFNMPYVGALKSTLFGLYLRAGGEFSAVSWRVLGILLMAIAVWIATRAMARRFGGPAAALFACLWLTDITFLVYAARDVGPIALSTLLRAGVLAVLLTGARTRSSGAATGGFLVGLAVFEKLNHAVLLPILLLGIGVRRRGRLLRRWTACLLGVALGAAPLIWANATTWATESGPLSLSVRVDSARAPHFHLVPDLLQMGAGTGTRWILGEEAIENWKVPEGFALFLALVAATWIGGRAARRWTLYWMMTAGLILLLPASVATHHLTGATPLQYVAIAIGLARPANLRKLRRLTRARAGALTRWGVGLSALGLGGWALLRAAGLAGTLHLMATGWGSLWHPSLTRTGEWLAPQAGEATVLLGEWGVGTQIYSLAQGKLAVLPAFARYEGDSSLETWLARVRTQRLILVGRPPGRWKAPRSTDQMLADLRRRNDWEEETANSPGYGAVDLRPVLMWSFRRAAPQD